MDDYLFKQMPLGDVADYLTDLCGEIADDDHQAMVAMHIILEAIAMRLREPIGEVRLWDTQWLNIVNHDNCYRGWDKEEAIAHAVKMTELSIASNVADGKLPKKRKED